MGTRVTPSAIHFADKALAGVPRLLDDLQRLVEDRETADIVFIVGREEVPIYAHRLILRARYASFKVFLFVIIVLCSISLQNFFRYLYIACQNFYNKQNW